MEKQNTPISNEPREEKSIFSEEDFSLDIYDKHIKQARGAIFTTAGIILLSALILFFNLPEKYEYWWIDVIFYGIFIIGFAALGLWTKKKPYTAISCALILYGIFIGINAYFDIKTLFSGIIIKIIIISLLVKGLSDAKSAQEMQQLRK